MYNLLNSLASLNERQSILDIGVAADRSNKADNFFEMNYPYKERITSLSDQDAKFLEINAPA